MSKGQGKLLTKKGIYKKTQIKVCFSKNLTWLVNRNLCLKIIFFSHIFLSQYCVPKCLVWIGQWFPKSAPRTTGGPRDYLKWSSKPYINQHFVLDGPPNFSKWSANRKSLGTTGIGPKVVLLYVNWRITIKKLSKTWLTENYLCFKTRGWGNHLKNPPVLVSVRINSWLQLYGKLINVSKEQILTALWSLLLSKMLT